MRLSEEESRWRVLRLEMRTYTQSLASMHRNELVQAIPDNYNYIGDYCFKNNGKIKEVLLPLGCKIIGKEAFFCCQFRKPVKFPETLVEIKSSAFAGNHNLQKAKFPASLEKIREQCYKDCNNLRLVIFASGSRCREIPEEGFKGCIRLEQLTLPEKLEVIGKHAFYKCKDLKEIHFPESLRQIGDQAFYSCGVEKLELPGNLQEIGAGAFFKCNSLKSVIIPQNVNRIGEKAFHGCNRLETLTFFHDPEEIGSSLVNRNCIIRCRKGGKVDAYCQESELKREYIA